MDRKHPLDPALTLVLASQMGMACVVAVWAMRGDWTNFSVGLASLMLSTVPLLVVRTPDLRSLVSVVISLLLVSHVVVGMWLGLYELSSLYDKFMHVVGSSAVALIVYAALKAYCTTRLLALPKALQGALVFSVTLSLGVLWEVFEFGVDRTGLFYAQRGLTDTMIDLIADSIGAVLAILLFLAAKAHTALALDLDLDLDLR